MILIQLKDQLGNQMFAYASAKTIATKKKIKFGFYRVPIENKYINDTDVKYGNDLFTIFDLPEEEWVKTLPNNYKIYKERSLKERNDKNYINSVVSEISDDCIMDGHFISPAYFEDNIIEVREWFSFPKEVEDKMIRRVSDISENGKYKIVTVHFRVGKDYTILGYRLNKMYWLKAAKKAQELCDNIRFVCVYDKKTKEITEFIKKFDAIDMHGSLLEDMIVLANADGNIVCNSTFSIMSSLLNKRKKFTICPDKYPSQIGYMPDNIFPDEWIKISGIKRNIVAGICYRIHYLKRLFLRK